MHEAMNNQQSTMLIDDLIPHVDNVLNQKFQMQTGVNSLVFFRVRKFLQACMEACRMQDELVHICGL